MDCVYSYNENAKPFFDIVMKGLKEEVDGAAFWDAVAENAVFEFCYDVPGFTNRFNSRAEYMEWFDGYSMQLTSADNLRVYKCADNIVVLEYEVHGKAPNTGKDYHNKFCSIVTIKNRKIVHWRDYMDTFAVIRAVS